MRIKTSLMAIMIILWSSCGGSIAEHANKSLSTAISATNAASEQFTKWDKQHQLDIVDKATTRQEAEDGLREYREKRQRIVQAFTVAYSSMATASAMVPLVQAGEKSDADLIKLLAESVGAVQSVISSIKEIRAAFNSPAAPPVAEPDIAPAPAHPDAGPPVAEPADAAPVKDAA